MPKTSFKVFKTPLDILKEYNLNENIAFIQPFIIDELYGLNSISKYNLLHHHVPVLPDSLKHHVIK